MSVSHRSPTSGTILRSDADAKPQFLNSVIGSIGNKDHPHPPQLPPASQSRNDSSGENSSPGRNGSVSTAARATPPLQKRKAEEDLPRGNEKVVRTTIYRGSSSMLSPYTTSQDSLQAKKSSNLPINPSKQILPNRSATNIPTSAPPAKAVPRAPPPDGSKAPKKGSFAEIMARSKANQEAPQAVGVIRHQAKDKRALSHKKELLLQKKGKLLGKSKNQAPNDHSRNSSGDMSSGSASKLPGKNGTGTGKRGPEIPYRNTAHKPASSRPQPTYKGTMATGKAAAAPGPRKPLPQRHNGRDNGPRYQREYYSEDEESEIEEEGGYSEESDDMEAGFDDVEEEETTARKLARKEDDEEARVEAELKRQKEARKKRLQELAKKQGAKKPMY